MDYHYSVCYLANSPSFTCIKFIKHVFITNEDGLAIKISFILAFDLLRLNYENNNKKQNTKYILSFSILLWLQTSLEKLLLTIDKTVNSQFP